MIRRTIIAIVLITLMLTGCNSAAKHFGGTMTIDLPKGQKLVNATWKDTSLWYLTKPMTDADKAETYTFKEDSTFGVMQGTVIIVEHK